MPAVMYYSTTVCGFQKGRSANMFYTCGPNEAMVVSGKIVAFYFFTKYHNDHEYVVRIYTFPPI